MKLLKFVIFLVRMKAAVVGHPQHLGHGVVISFQRKHNNKKTEERAYRDRRKQAGGLFQQRRADRRPGLGADDAVIIAVQTQRGDQPFVRGGFVSPRQKLRRVQREGFPALEQHISLKGGKGKKLIRGVFAVQIDQIIGPQVEKHAGAVAQARKKIQRILHALQPAPAGKVQQLLQLIQTFPEGFMIFRQQVQLLQGKDPLGSNAVSAFAHIKQDLLDAPGGIDRAGQLDAEANHRRMIGALQILAAAGDGVGLGNSGIQLVGQ